MSSLKKMLLAEYEERKKRLAKEIAKLENLLKEKEAKLIKEELERLKKAEEKAKLLQKKINDTKKESEIVYIVEFEDGTTAEIPKKSLVAQLQDTTTSSMPKILPVKWRIGQKIKYKGKKGVVKKIEPMLVIDLEGKEIKTSPSALEEVFECNPKIPLEFMYPTQVKNLEELGRTPNEREPFFVEEYLRGERCSVHKIGNDVKSYPKLPEVILQKFYDICPYDYVIDGIYNNERFMIVDIAYYKDNSVADLKLYERKKILSTFNLSNDIRLLPWIEVKNEEDLKKAVEVCQNTEGSEGAVIKDYNSTYTPGYSRFWKLFKKKKELAEEPQLFKPYWPMKPFGSAYYKEKDAVDKLKEGKEYSFEFKYNGFHAVAHKKGKDVKIYSEQLKDISVAFPTLREAIYKIAPNHDFIVDGELVPYSPEGKALGRDPLMKFIGAVKSGKKLDDSSIKMHVFDITYFDKPVINLPLRERQKILDKLKFNKRVQRVLYKTGTKKDALKFIEWATNLPGSEGCVIKDLDSPYVFDEKSRGWIKFRHLVDIHALVLEKVPKKRGLFNYLIGIYVNQEEAKRLHPKYLTDFKGKKVLVLGHTFNTPKEVPEGSIIDVALEDVWRHTYPKTHKVRYSIHKPRFRQRRPDLKTTSSIQDLEDIVTSIGEEVIEDIEAAEKEYFKILKEETWEEALKKGGGEGGTRYEAAVYFWDKNWWRSFPKSGHGIFVYHHHYRGLTKEESKLSEEELLNTDNSVHGDLRCQVNKRYLWGFTVFTGSTKDLKEASGCRLCKLHGNQKMQGTFKLYEPIEWAYVGRKKPLVTGPGHVGATKNYYAKFFAIDWGTYDCGVWRKHAFEIFLHGKKLKGRFIIQFAPVAGRRIWLISHPEDQRPYAETHNIKEVIAELRKKHQKYLIWAKPGEKPVLIDVEHAKDKR